MTTPAMTCSDFQALLPDYLESDTLGADERARAEAHLLDCAECAALVADLRSIVQQAGELPLMEPSQDLWSGVEARIAATVVQLPVAANVVAPRAALRHWSPRRLALAASLLVVATAGITWSVARNHPVLVVPADPAGSSSAVATTGVSQAANKPTVDQTYDREIAALRTLVDQRRAELDSATIGILEKNLKLIDQAIRESRAALANDPASTFLNDRLNRAYDTKLQLMRDVATMPARS